MIRLRRSLAEESGVALVLVLIAVVIVTVMGAALLAAGTRDLESSGSVQRASSALGVAEAAVQHGIQTLKVVGPTHLELSRIDCTNPQNNASIPCYPDLSADGKGRWMNPTSTVIAPALEDQIVGSIGANDLYRVYITAVQPVDLTAIPPVTLGVYRVVATGFENRNNQVRPGTRTVEQNVRVRVLDVPFSLFAKDGISGGGTPKVFDVSMYSTSDIFWRNRMDFQGTDEFYGGPAAAHATGVIFKGNGVGINGPIHPPNPNCPDFPYDRDKNGAAFAGAWGPPCPNPAPPYTSSFFNESMLPFDKDGPSNDTYEFLKGLAKSTGIYCTHAANSTLIFQDNQGAPSAGCNRGMQDITEKFFVLYVDVTGSGNVAIKAKWGPQGDPDAACATYDGSFGIIVVRGGDLSYENNTSWWGAAFVPEGELSASGNGNAWFVGTVYAKTMDITGNARFTLTDCWLDRSVGPFFFITRLRWHEADRPG